MRALVFCSIILALAVIHNSVLSAEMDEKTILINTRIPTLPVGLSISISKVLAGERCTPDDDVWPQRPNFDSSTSERLVMDFGTLVFDDRSYTRPDGTTAKYNIFRTGTSPGQGGFYYAVDVAVSGNTRTGWMITIEPRSIIGPYGKTLDNNINVAYAFASEGKAEQMITKSSFSRWFIVKDTDFPAGSWLRIYYGIASGIKANDPNPDGCSADADGVVPITNDYPPGVYTGSVSISLSGR